MRIRYFEIRSPRPDFTGRVGGISFADGVARVAFDDTRDSNGAAVGDEHQVQVGRSAVLFARRRFGYSVVEVDEAGQPLADQTAATPAEPIVAGDEMPSRAASKADWKAYATSPDRGMTDSEAEALTRDQLVAHFLGPKEASA